MIFYSLKLETETKTHSCYALKLGACTKIFEAKELKQK